MTVTARAHTNIALIKYWGKRDQKLILPQTDSLSLTLKPFYTDTTVNFSPDYQQDHFSIDGREVSPKTYQRLTSFLNIVRQQAGISLAAHVDSINHVPTAAGLASSASAFAALALAASRAAGLNLSSKDLSRLARRGSGSATRSIYGGLVQWHRGHDDASSYAEPIMEKVDFGLEMIAILLDTHQKKISSRAGMQEVVATSPYYPAWRQVVASGIIAIKKAIAARDIDRIGHISQENALRMHALNLAADPGFTYFNADTLATIHLIDQLHDSGLSCYYTMDAGPNVKVIYDRRDRQKLLGELKKHFASDQLVVAEAGPGAAVLNENKNK